VRAHCGAHSRPQNSRCGHAFAAGNLAASTSSAREPIDRYYVDFVCRERRVIIELDGGQHSECPPDRQRHSELCALGYRVIRIWNNYVIENLDD